jgi:hypothetical protein
MDTSQALPRTAARLMPAVVGKILEALATKYMDTPNPTAYTDKEAREILGRCVSGQGLVRFYDTYAESIRLQIEAQLPQAIADKRSKNDYGQAA